VLCPFLGERGPREKHEEQRAQFIETKAVETDRTGLFKWTQWLEHLIGRHLAHLAHQTRLPNTDELELQRAAELIKQLIEQSVHEMVTLGHETRRWLQSAHQYKVDQRPLA
jgi:hypothetical protein